MSIIYNKHFDKSLIVDLYLGKVNSEKRPQIMELSPRCCTLKITGTKLAYLCVYKKIIYESHNHVKNESLEPSSYKL